jgi:hypothetical protein
MLADEVPEFAPERRRAGAHVEVHRCSSYRTYRAIGLQEFGRAECVRQVRAVLDVRVQDAREVHG